MKLFQMTIADYQRELTRLREESSTTIFDNDQFDHAKILISELADMATYEINIYSTAFCDTFFNDSKVLNAFNEAAKRNVKLNVITSLNTKVLDNPEYSNTLHTYEEMFKNNGIKVHVGTPLEYIDADTRNKEQFNNFMVVDGKGIRYEKALFTFSTDCHRTPRKEMQANGCFNDPEIAAALNNCFFDALNNNNFVQNF